mmetsp:Transcript_22607/g.89747  ORF Transcript_22607/g.89747 Transcript_22607/m.89747 type:complete len:234 (-) Transcript_22607:1519-2220(-)
MHTRRHHGPARRKLRGPRVQRLCRQRTVPERGKRTPGRTSCEPLARQQGFQYHRTKRQPPKDAKPNRGQPPHRCVACPQLKQQRDRVRTEQKRLRRAQRAAQCCGRLLHSEELEVPSRCRSPVSAWRRPQSKLEPRSRGLQQQPSQRVRHIKPRVGLRGGRATSRVEPGLPCARSRWSSEASWRRQQGDRWSLEVAHGLRCSASQMFAQRRQREQRGHHWWLRCSNYRDRRRS